MRELKSRALLWGCATSLFWIGLAFAQKPVPQVGPPTTPPDKAAPASATAAKPTVEGTGQPVDPNKFLIGPEDVLSVSVWRQPDFSRLVAVRPDGKITMPLIGDVQAGGLTPMQLTKELTDKLGTYLNRPDVTVVVQEVRSKKYYIDGEVNHPGVFPLITPTRVLEALSNASGFRDFANTKHIKILRGKQTFDFNWNEVSKGKHMEQNIYLEDGDHIIVK